MIDGEEEKKTLWLGFSRLLRRSTVELWGEGRIGSESVLIIGGAVECFSCEVCGYLV